MGRIRRLAVVVALAVAACANVSANPSAERALLDAARAGDQAAALALIAEGADVNVRLSDGSSALMWAAHHGDAALAEQLIAAGADVTTPNAFGATAMEEAALSGVAPLIELLLDAGADVDSPNAYGQTALMIVSRSGHRDAAELLLRRGADVNAVEQWQGQTALMWAAAQRHPEIVSLLVEYGADIDARAEVKHFDSYVTAEPRAQHRVRGGMTALLYAAREGCLDCVRTLVEGGADLDLPEPEGTTALQMAINNMHFDLARYLLEQGADPNQWDWWGRSPLYAAVDMNTIPRGGRADRPSTDQTTSLELIQLLLDAGANPNLQLKRRPPFRAVGPDRGCDNMLVAGATPLLRAAKALDADAIELLLAHGALVDLPQVIGITPVMAAAGLGSWDCDTRGSFETPDVEQRSIRALEILLAAGGDLDARITGTPGRFPEQRAAMADRIGQTALHGAAFWGWNAVVEFLVERGATLDVADSRGMTPVDAALGRAGGNGFGGNRVDVHEDTAELLERLIAQRVARDR